MAELDFLKQFRQLNSFVQEILKPCDRQETASAHWIATHRQMMAYPKEGKPMKKMRKARTC
jgi:hypothetical protein